MNTNTTPKMQILKFAEVPNINGESYFITCRKHTTGETFEKYGYPYSIKIVNVDQDTFDLNEHLFLYDHWQTAYKRFRELVEDYKTVRVSPYIRKN